MLMTSNWRDWYHLRHQQGCLVSGAQFEDYVTRILARFHDDFTNPAPSGTLGDGGCDGLADAGKILYACYGQRPARNAERELQAKLVSDFIDQGPKDGEHWMLKILRSVLIYLRAVGRAWEFIFGKIFDGVSWMATKIDGLITRLDMLARIANVKWDITGNLKRGGKTVLGALDSAGVAVGNAAEGATQRLFAPKTPMMSVAPPVVQSKSINATYAPVINQQPGQSGTEVANESQRLFDAWMSSQVESASAAVGAK